MSDDDGAENLETRAGDSVTSGNLEAETGGVDAVGAMAELRVCTLSLDGGVGKPPWAARCSAGDESLSGSGEDSALSWTDAAGGCVAGRGASGKSNRDSSALMDSLPLSGRVTSGSSDAAR
jgi:hypothetical protein